MDWVYEKREDAMWKSKNMFADSIMWQSGDMGHKLTQLAFFLLPWAWADSGSLARYTQHGLFPVATTIMELS